MANWWDEVNEVDQDSLDESSSSLPYCQVLNGDPKLAKLGVDDLTYRGGLFMKGDLPGADEFAAAQDWAACESPWAGDPDGYAGDSIACQIITYRRAWTWDGGMKPWDMYDEALAEAAGERVKGRLQVQVLPKGMNEPYVITLGGMQGALFNKSRKGDSVLDMFKHCIQDPFNEATRKHGVNKKWPYRAFMVTLGMALVDGKPVFREVGKKPNTFQLTPLTLLNGDAPMVEPLTEQQILDGIYVGGAQLKVANLLYDAAEDWRNAWATVEAIQANTTQQPEQKVDTSEYDDLSLEGDEAF